MVHAFGDLGSGIGKAGITPSTAPGLQEFFFDGISDGQSGPSDTWHAMRYHPASRTYLQVYSSPPIGGDIRKIQVADLHPRPGEEILIGLSNGDIHAYHQRTKELLTVWQTGHPLMDFQAYDLNQDGQNEFLAMGPDGLRMYRSDGQQFANFNQMDGVQILIDQLDLDPGIEIVSTTGHVLDYQSRLIQCELPAGFGSALAAADADNDGIKELLYLKVDETVWIYDVDTCRKKRSMDFDRIQFMMTADTNADGVEELILGFMGYREGIASIDFRTGYRNWEIIDERSGAHSITFHDADRDGRDEILWGSGSSIEGESLMVGNYRTGQVEWISPDPEGPFLGPLRGDLDGDGVDEIVTVSEGSRYLYGGALIIALEQHSFLSMISEETLHGREAESMDLFDYDNDGDMEVFVGGRDSLQVYDLVVGTGFQLVLDIHPAQSTGFRQLSVVDVDQDGTTEILAIGLESSSTTLRSYDMVTGAEEWRSSSVGSASLAMAVEDFDGDGTLEVATLSWQTGLNLFDASGNFLAAYPGDYEHLQAAPSTPGFPTSMILSDEDGSLIKMSWDGVQIQEVTSRSFLSDAIDGFTLWTNSLFFAASDSKLNLINIVTGAIVWTSPDYDDGFAPTFGKVVIPLDNGDFAVCGPDGVYSFRSR